MSKVEHYWDRVNNLESRLLIVKDKLVKKPFWVRWRFRGLVKLAEKELFSVKKILASHRDVSKDVWEDITAWTFLTIHLHNARVLISTLEEKIAKLSRW